MATVYNVLDTRDKQELTERIDSDKNELSKTIQNTKTELQSNIDALESQHDEDKTELQAQIDSLESIKADKTELSAHNTSDTAHNDIRLLIQNLTTKLNTIADGDDSTLDQMSEIVEYIKNNKELIDSITTTKVSVSDIINNLVTNVANKPLSAAMGVELKALIDAIPDTTLATVNEKILEHNVSADAHEDIRNDIASVQSEATAAQTTADAAQVSADNAQDDADEALQRLNSLEVGSGKIDRTVEGSGILTCEDPLIGAPLIETAVRGRTVKNLWPSVESVAKNGVTVTMDGSGLMKISGTATSDTTLPFGYVMMAASKEYAFAASSKAAGVRVLVNQYHDSEVLSPRALDIDLTTTAIATGTASDEANSFFAYLYIPSGTAVNASFRVMLVEGTEALDCFTPPASITSAQAGNLVTAGKNLFQYTKQTGIFFTGGILQAGTYTMSLESLADWWTNNGGNGRYIYYYMYDNLEAAAAAAAAAGGGGGSSLRGFSSADGINFANADVGVRSSATFAPRTSGCILFVAYYGATWIDQVTNIQIELGSTATAYEPPDVTEVELPDTDPLMYVYDRGDEMVVAQDGAVTVERNTYHQLFDGGTAIANNGYIPIDADGYQYVALNTTKDKPTTGATISMYAVVSDRFAIGKRAPGYVVLTTGSVSVEGRNFIAMLFCFEPGKFADASEARQWFVDNPTSVWFVGMPETEYLGTIDPPALPAQTSNIWFSSNIPVNDFSVRYWLPNGELVEELYRTGATEEISDNEIISIWNGATGDIVEATNADIEAIFE